MGYSFTLGSLYITLGNFPQVGDGIPNGRLFIIGGGEDRCCGAGVLERFVELSGGGQARITLVTTATGIPDEVHAEYEQVFRKLGVDSTTELRLRGRADADSDLAESVLRDATGVFFSGGDQSRIRALVGSGESCASKCSADCAFDRLAVSGWFSSCAIAPESSPRAETRIRCANSWRCSAASASATFWPVTSTKIPLS